MKQKKDYNIIIRIDKDKKELFQKILEKEGCTSSKVLSIFIEEICNEGKAPNSIIKKYLRKQI